MVRLLHFNLCDGIFSNKIRVVGQGQMIIRGGSDLPNRRSHSSSSVCTNNRDPPGHIPVPNFDPVRACYRAVMGMHVRNTFRQLAELVGGILTRETHFEAISVR